MSLYRYLGPFSSSFLNLSEKFTRWRRVDLIFQIMFDKLIGTIAILGGFIFLKYRWIMSYSILSKFLRD